MSIKSNLPFVSGVHRLTNSTKALVVIVSVLCVTALAYVGRIPASEAVEFLKWALLGFLGAVALEDGAKKMTPSKKVSAIDPVLIQTILTTVSQAFSQLGRSQSIPPPAEAPDTIPPEDPYKEGIFEIPDEPPKKTAGTRANSERDGG